MLNKVPFFLTISLFFLFEPLTHAAAPAKKSSYSIQISALPLSQKDDGFRIYGKLKERGYLVYYYKVRIKDSWWMRLKLGIFPSTPEARAFGKQFSEKEGFAFFVTRAAATIHPFKNEYEIISTPSAIWLRKGANNREIFQFSKNNVATTEILSTIRPVISPDGSKITFDHDSGKKTITVPVENDVDQMKTGTEASTLKDSGRIPLETIDHAISELSKVIIQKPENARAYYNRGNLYQRKGLDDKAIADYGKALELNPGFTEVYNNRGVAYRRKGLYDLAIADYSQAIRLSPDDAEAYNNRGIAYSMGKALYEDALANFNRAIEIDPGYAKAFYNRGFVYFLKKDYDNAWQDIRKAHDLGYQLNPDFIKRLREASGQ